MRRLAWLPAAALLACATGARQRLPSRAAARSPAPYAGFAFLDMYVFPDPTRGKATLRAQLGRADSVSVEVYDGAGRLAHSGAFGAPAVFDDANGRGPQVTYEYSWDAGAPGPGVYRCVVTARRAGSAPISRSVSVRVER